MKLIYSDTDGAYLSSGVEPGELAITSPIQAPFEGMSITVMQRMEDGTIKNHSREASGLDDDEPEDDEASDEAVELVNTSEEGAQ